MCCICNEKGDYEVYENTIGQYIELKDKNGKEIYEGDIVKFNNSFGVLTGMIRYYANCKPIIKSNNKRSVDIAECNEEDLKVIGNIYENAELLEGEE